MLIVLQHRGKVCQLVLYFRPTKNLSLLQSDVSICYLKVRSDDNYSLGALYSSVARVSIIIRGNYFLFNHQTAASRFLLIRKINKINHK